LIREIRGYFDRLHFTESLLGTPRIEDSLLRVSVSGLFLLAGHPLDPKGGGPYKGEFVFEGVIDSRRKVIEYIGDSSKPKGFREAYETVDEIPLEAKGGDGIQEFGFEGFQEATNAWIDWVVKAQSFTLRIFDHGDAMMR
jgi:hypothetical protein